MVIDSGYLSGKRAKKLCWNAWHHHNVSTITNGIKIPDSMKIASSWSNQSIILPTVRRCLIRILSRRGASSGRAANASICLSSNFWPWEQEGGFMFLVVTACAGSCEPHHILWSLPTLHEELDEERRSLFHPALLLFFPSLHRVWCLSPVLWIRDY